MSIRDYCLIENRKKNAFVLKGKGLFFTGPPNGTKKATKSLTDDQSNGRSGKAHSWSRKGYSPNSLEVVFHDQRP